MFKVMCIMVGSCDPNACPPVVGNIYTVKDTWEPFNQLYYNFQEIKDWHNSKCFVLLSEIDEIELIKEREVVEC